MQFSDVSAELFKFSTDTMEWTDLSAAGVVKGTMPSVRTSHGMTAVGKDIYLFGGQTVDGGEEEGHLHAELKGSRRSLTHFTLLHISPSIPHDIISVYPHGVGRAQVPSCLRLCPSVGEQPCRGCEMFHTSRARERGWIMLR